MGRPEASSSSAFPWTPRQEAPHAAANHGIIARWITTGGSNRGWHSTTRSSPTPVDRRETSDGSVIVTGGAPAEVVVQLTGSIVIVFEDAAEWNPPERLSIVRIMAVARERVYPLRIAFPFPPGHGYFATEQQADRWRSRLETAGVKVIEEGTRPAMMYFVSGKRGARV